jgi:hypothetical protein
MKIFGKMPSFSFKSNSGVLNDTDTETNCEKFPEVLEESNAQTFEPSLKNSIESVLQANNIKFESYDTFLKVDDIIILSQTLYEGPEDIVCALPPQNYEGTPCIGYFRKFKACNTSKECLALIEKCEKCNTTYIRNWFCCREHC